MSHYHDRLGERFNSNDAARYGRLVEYIAAKLPSNNSHAVRIAKLPAMVGRAWSDTSNGDTAWCIIREGRIITVMYRRQTQPTTAYALKVDRVWSVENEAGKVTIRMVAK